MPNEIELKYVEGNGIYCMSCGGSELDAGKMQTDAGYAWCEIECPDCGSTWSELYYLASVTGAVLVKPPKVYVHTCSFSFEIESNKLDGSDLTGIGLQNALTDRIWKMDSDEFKGECEIFDSTPKDE